MHRGMMLIGRQRCRAARPGASAGKGGREASAYGGAIPPKHQRRRRAAGHDLLDQGERWHSMRFGHA